MVNDVRVIVIDDSPSVRLGLHLRLQVEPDLVLVGESGDGVTGLELARRLQPDVVLLDYNLPDCSGIDLIPALRAISDRLRVIVLSVHDSPDLRERARLAGAAAYVGKHEPEHVLLDAIRAAARR